MPGKLFQTLLILFLLGGSVFSLSAQKDQPVAPSESLSAGQNDSIPLDPRVRIGQLENGMYYYIMHNEKPENRAELRLALRAGSMQEDEDQLGVAHFVEHMCFNGTANFEKNELVDYLESVGTRFGPDLNAYTSFDETVYMLQVRTDDPGHLDTGLLVLQDWAGAVSFDEEEIDKERGVVISEWRTRLSANQRMQQEYFPVLYHESRYAERLPIGKPEIIEEADYETIRRFYKDWYRPDLMAIVVVGDVDVHKMEKEVISRFSKLENPVNPRTHKEYDVPGHEETLISVTSDKEAAFTTVRYVIKHDHEQATTLGEYRQKLVQYLYNRMLNNRLDELAQSANPPFIFAYTGFGQDVGDLATYTSYAMVPQGQALTGLKALMRENQRVLQHGFLESELKRAKETLMNQAERAVKEMDKTESSRLAGRYVYHFLDNNPIPSPAQTLEIYKNYFPGITLDEINQLADHWITPENRVFIVTGPEKEEVPLPDEKAIRLTMQAAEAEEVAPYEDDVSDEPLMAAKLQPAEIVETTLLQDLEIEQWELENGVEVIVKPTDFKNDQILLRAYSPGGHSLYDLENYKQARYATSVIEQSGISTFSNTQLEKKLAGKNVSVNPYISELWEGFSGNCSPEDLETFFQLIYLYFTDPRKDPDALSSFVNKQKGIYENLLSNPNYWFSNETQKIKYDNHPRKGLPEASDMDALQLDKIYELYRDRFANAGDFRFYLVGNFTIEDIKPLVQTYLGNLPSIDRKESWRDIEDRLVDGRVIKQFYRGEAPKALVDITYHGEFEWTTENRFHFQSLMDVMRIKLRESMREDEGGVYGVSLRGYTTKYPTKSYVINISFNSDPENVDHLIETAMADIQKTVEEGVSEKNLNKIKETQIQQRIKQLERNNFWISNMEYADQYGLSYESMQLEYLKERLNKLTREDLHKAAKTYFNPENFIQLVLFPEEKPEEEENK